jgi:anti-anti-sigma factor
MVAGLRPSREPKKAPAFRTEERCPMPDPAYKQISATMVEDVVVIEIKTKEFQHPAVAQELGNELSRAAAEFRARKFLVDFAGVKYLGSVGFAALSRTVKTVRGAGGQIKFCNMAPSILAAADMIFGAEIVGSQLAVEIHDSRVRALVSFAMS